MRVRHLVGITTLAVMLSTSQASAQPLTLTCAPGQRAILHQTYVRGEPVTRAQCVYAGSSRGGYYHARYYRARPHRSWGKTALTIAGGAGTGAGIGGAIRGKKGALVGAALGGGVASLYESAKRR